MSKNSKLLHFGRNTSKNHIKSLQYQIIIRQSSENATIYDFKYRTFLADMKENCKNLSKCAIFDIWQ